VEEPRHVPRHVALGAPDERHLGQPLVHPVGDLAGTANRVQLTLVLDRAQLLDDAAARHELEPALLQHLELRIRERRRLEGDPPRERLGELREHRTPRLHRLDAGDGARRVDVAEVREQPHALLVDEQDRVRAVEADEVEDVLRVRDEQRLLELLAQAGDAVAHPCSFRYSRARR